MNKRLIGMALLVAVGAASAQSSITLFGIADASLQRISHGGTGSKMTRLHNSGESSSRLGFRGTEDLGSGLAASFWLEAAVNNDSGTGTASNANNQVTGAAPALAGGQGLMFNRRSTVSLAGAFGEVRLGRDYTPQFWNLGVFDPFGTNGIGTNQMANSITLPPAAGGAGINILTAVRASNTIGYFLPGNLSGLYGQAQLYLGENASNVAAPASSSDGSGWGVRIGYQAGALNVAAATSRTRAAATGDFTQSNLAGSWNFGVATLMGQVSRDEVGAPTNVSGRGYLLGGLVPVGPGTIKVAFSQYTTDAAVTTPRARKLAVGYVHNFSKRTAVYGTYARVNNSDGSNMPVVPGTGVSGANASSSGLELGVRHAF